MEKNFVVGSHVALRNDQTVSSDWRGLKGIVTHISPFGTVVKVKFESCPNGRDYELDLDPGLLGIIIVNYGEEDD